MVIYVDIDETIADYQPDQDRKAYDKATPIDINIEKINKLYDEGNEIIYWTARGTLSGIDWYGVTKQQLDDWGCKYHKVITGQKPAYDLLICDKSKRIEEL